jgi:CRISPR-associated protein Cas2
MKGKYLICYDITDHRRLQKVYNYLKGLGRHIQYSVFFCVLSREDLREVKDALNALIEPRTDDVRIYTLPEKFQVAVLGRGDRLPEGVVLFE